MKINYEPFYEQTSSTEDLYLFGEGELSLKNLLEHYSPSVRIEANKLKRMGVKRARARVKKHFSRV